VGRRGKRRKVEGVDVGGGGGLRIGRVVELAIEVWRCGWNLCMIEVQER
jgi:hypothetical protein